MRRIYVGARLFALAFFWMTVVVAALAYFFAGWFFGIEIVSYFTDSAWAKVAVVAVWTLTVFWVFGGEDKRQ